MTDGLRRTNVQIGYFVGEIRHDVLRALIKVPTLDKLKSLINELFIYCFVVLMFIGTESTLFLKKPA